MTTAIDEYRARRTVVVGSGVAGLSTALGLGTATVLTKGTLAGSGSTPWSQGGIAAALGADDSPALHAADTVAVAGGIADSGAARHLADRAPGRIGWLLATGADLDRDADGALALGREAGHSRRRIVHAGGDATGAEVARSLAAAVRAAPGIEVVERSFALDLIVSGGRVAGVLALEEGRLVAYLAGAVVLATGGVGRVYARTTNPPEVTGDGLAMAIRAGARVADLEFVQFHPTALAVEADPLPLLTEALRGEGAVLIDGAGRRFMPAVHPAAELAPRDIVARAVWQVLADGGAAFLDATAAVGDDFPERFPTVYGHARNAGLDPVREPLPVTPAAHYHMGGIAVDADGRASLPGLWACGEASSTGVHGANRLASNSLVEGMVYGDRVAAAIRREAEATPTAASVEVPRAALTVAEDDADVIAAVRHVMWEGAGVVRTGDGLAEAAGALRRLAARPLGPVARNLVEVGAAIAAAAERRGESRGAHFRRDHPAADPTQAARSFVAPAPARTVEIALPAPVAA